MNKIKISNEQERIKIEFDFDNIQVAREYFQNEECIEDIVEALDYELEEEEPKENESLKELKKHLKETLCKGSNDQLSEIQSWIQEELNSRK
jgi:hypothetical protein